MRFKLGLAGESVKFSPGWRRQTAAHMKNGLTKISKAIRSGYVIMFQGLFAMRPYQ
jgi:hypothetical protein